MAGREPARFRGAFRPLLLPTERALVAFGQRSFMKMTRLIPMLPVKSMPASVEFYQKLGFTVERRQDNWGWAMLRFDDCRLMVDQSTKLHPLLPRQGVTYLYTDDVAEFHRRVQSNGVRVPDLDVTFYGMTEFRIEDPDGNQLWIGQINSNGT